MLLLTRLVKNSITSTLMKCSFAIPAIYRHALPIMSLLPVFLSQPLNMFSTCMTMLLMQRQTPPLFSKQAWQKANVVLELARQGCLSDLEGVVLYERAGIDKHGLQLWKCL